MTESEAIKILQKEKTYMDSHAGRAQSEAFQIAINALENQINQIPKKPIFDFNSIDTLSRFHCTCGKIIWVHHDIGTMDNNDAPNYCSNCSIKLDWDE